MMLDQDTLQSIKLRYGIIGNAQRLNYALTVATQVAPTDMTVLINGESGTGKESFSKIIHNLSPRKHNKFIAINCGAIPEGTIDSELFGHEKGAFTGAQDSRQGYFEATDRGTIFLDEVGEMPLGTQSRLLRVLEYGEFIKVGSSKVLKTDVRVVAATNVNLIEAVQKGKFREDLYYRLNSVPISVPPLRDRGRDTELIFRKFATDFADRHRVKPISLTPEAEQVLLSYRFPGNIRELKNIVEQMSLLVEDREVDAATLRGFIPSVSNLPALYRDANHQEGASNAGYSERDLLYKVLFEMRRDMTELKKLVYQILQAEGLPDGGFNERGYSPRSGGGAAPSGSSDGRPASRPGSGYADRDYVDPGYGDSLIREHEHLFNEVDDELSSAEAENLARRRLYYAKSAPPESPAEDPYDVIEDITHETEDDGDLSLEKKEKELIIKALRKNDSKRKYAANDLGISERTLYRKIKQYEIE
ncbi:MAG: sigma 54-interacting transcriptional regulator [Tunicatimonas sp.]